MNSKFYDIHIFFGKGESYSKFYETKNQSTGADIIIEAYERGFIDKDELVHNDSCTEIDEQEFMDATLGVKAVGVEDKTLSVILTETLKGIAIDNNLVHSPDGKQWLFFDADLPLIEAMKKAHTKL